jgi:hypothetical protein
MGVDDSVGSRLPKSVFGCDGPASVSLAAFSSIFRRLLARQTPLAFSRALASRLFVFWQLRVWQVYACGMENVRPQTHT